MIGFEFDTTEEKRFKIEKAKQLAKENPNGYRHVRIVYDTDDFPAEHIDRVVHLCTENSTNEIE